MLGPFQVFRLGLLAGLHLLQQVQQLVTLGGEPADVVFQVAEGQASVLQLLLLARAVLLELLLPPAGVFQGLCLLLEQFRRGSRLPRVLFARLSAGSMDDNRQNDNQGPDRAEQDIEKREELKGNLAFVTSAAAHIHKLLANVACTLRVQARISINAAHTECAGYLLLP